MVEMKKSFQKEAEGIYRLKIPFESVYTSVFLVVAKEGLVLLDSATTKEDVDEWIVPALAELGYALSDIKYFVLSHRHYDHDGGLPRILQIFPDLEVIETAKELFCGICTYPLHGHAENCIGVLCENAKTLITADGLQVNGLADYPCNVPFKDAYKETLARVREDERIENLLFSHDYRPYNKDFVHGRENVLLCVDDCLRYIEGDQK